MTITKLSIKDETAHVRIRQGISTCQIVVNGVDISNVATAYAVEYEAGDTDFPAVWIRLVAPDLEIEVDDAQVKEMDVQIGDFAD